MNLNSQIQDFSLQKKFNSLKNTENIQQVSDLKKRLKQNKYMTDMEYISGAFLEMYVPYLKEIVSKLFEKGYYVETSSGFKSNSPEYQTLDGSFSLDYVTRNKLDKEGIKLRENDGIKSLVFFAEKPDLKNIKQKWLRIIDFLPDKGKLVTPSEKPDAKLFRRKYTSRNPKLQKKKMFEDFEYQNRISISKQVSKRIKKNPRPDKIELTLGIFIEELEPQVRDAVLTMNRKGYSTDLSGCVKDSTDQMIEGDFRLPENIIEKLKSLNVNVESNPSGYTRIQFSPEDADIRKIKKKWNEIVSLLPSRNRVADSSMTRRAREFRIKYS